MTKFYTSKMALREARPRSKRLLGIGSAGRSVSYVSESGEKYTLPPATNNTLGGVKVGSGIHVEEDGTISTDATKTLRIRIYRDDTTHAWTLDESEMTGQEMCDFFSEGNESAQIFVDTGLSETSLIYPAQLVFPGMNHVIVSAVVQSFIEYGIRKTTYEVELDGQDAASVSVSTSEKVSQTLLIRLYKDSTTHAWTLDESEMTGQEMAEALGSESVQNVQLVIDDWYDGEDHSIPAMFVITAPGHVLVRANLTNLSTNTVSQDIIEIVLDAQSGVDGVYVGSAEVTVPIMSVVVPISYSSGAFVITGGTSAAEAIRAAIVAKPETLVFISYLGRLYGCYYSYADRTVYLKARCEGPELKEFSVQINNGGSHTVSYNDAIPTAGENQKGMVKVGSGLKMSGDALYVEHPVVHFNISLHATTTVSVYPDLSLYEFSQICSQKATSPALTLSLQSGKDLPAGIESNIANPTEVVIVAMDFTPNSLGGLNWTRHKITWTESGKTYTSTSGTIPSNAL